MNHTHYTSETIRLDPSNGSVKDSEKNVLLQPADNIQRKKVSSFQITSIRPTSRSSNDGADDSENDTEDTSDILDVSRSKDIEETPSFSEEFSKSEEVFISNPLNTGMSQQGSSTTTNLDDGGPNSRQPQGVTVNVTQGGLALAKAGEGLSDWQKRFKIVKISSNEKFQRGRWTCFDFHDSPAVTAAESKSEVSHTSSENTVVIPNTDPNMPGFLQVPIPVISGESSQPITPIAVHYPSTKTIVQGTISLSTGHTADQGTEKVSDCSMNAPYCNQTSLQQPKNYISDPNISYSPIHTSVIQSTHSTPYMPAQEPKLNISNRPEERSNIIQHANMPQIIPPTDASHLASSSAYSSMPLSIVGEQSYVNTLPNVPPINQQHLSYQNTSGITHILGHPVSTQHPTTKQMTLPGISASSSNIAHGIAQQSMATGMCNC